MAETTVLTVILSAAIQLIGLFINSNLTKFRIEQLEKKVDKHTALIERMALVEQSVRSAHHRISDILKGRGNDLDG